MTTFFSDRDLGKSFPSILRASGIAVQRHADHFAPDTADETWLAEVGRRRWFALTHNKRIRYQPNERDAVMIAGVGLFVLIGHAPTTELAENFVRSVSRIEQFIRKHEPPFIAKVSRPTPAELNADQEASGRVEVWLTALQWRASHRRGR